MNDLKEQGDKQRAACLPVFLLRGCWHGEVLRD